MDWYYARGEERVGPISEGEFATLVDCNVITGDTYVWNSDWADWRRYHEYAGQQAPVTTDDLFSENLFTDVHALVCFECGETKHPDEVLLFQGFHICARCKPVFFQRLKQGALNEYQQRYAGFWIRFLAKFIDSVLMGAISFAISAAMSGNIDHYMGVAAIIVSSLFSIFIGFLFNTGYETYLVGRYGATLGKMACGLEIIVGDGSRVSYPRALGRSLAEIISGMILYVGYLMVVFDDQKRSLHDMICDTRVIHKGLR